MLDYKGNLSELHIDLPAVIPNSHWLIEKVFFCNISEKKRQNTVIFIIFLFN